MPEYRVALKPSAEKELLRLPNTVLEHIFAKIEILADQPRPVGSKKLRGSKNLWRIRMGDYRVVYSIDYESKLVEVMRIAHRREVYE